MDGVVESVKACDEPDLIQGTLDKRLVLGTAFLLDKGGGYIADLSVDLGGVCHDAIALKFVTFGLHEVLTFPIELGRPDFVRGRPILIFK